VSAATWTSWSCAPTARRDPDLLGADVDALPVPADVLHYTESELAEVLAVGWADGATSMIVF
jgi:hypothetical protein